MPQLSTPFILKFVFMCHLHSIYLACLKSSTASIAFQNEVRTEKAI